MGTHAVILPGINIGKDAIIGAGAVVTKNVPSFAIAAGVPVKKIKYRKKIKNETKKTLLFTYNSG